MTPPRKSGAQELQRHQQHRQQPQSLSQQEERDNNNNEMHANAIEQPSNHDEELSVVDLVTQSNQMVNNNGNINDNNSTNLVNEIRSLAATVAADSRARNNVDDVLILHYEHNDVISSSGNNNNVVNNDVMHFNGIHIRNNNNTLHNRVNSLVSGQIQHNRVPPEGISDNARSGIFHASASAINGSDLIVCHHASPVAASNFIQYNPEAGVNRADAAERQEQDIAWRVDLVNDEDGGGAEVGGGHDAAESAQVLFAAQLDIAATTPPTIERSESANSAFIPIVAANVDGFVVHEYLQPQSLHNSRSRSRRRRRRRGRGRRTRGGRQQRNQIRSSLKSMNKILRKTMYTLRRIRSLIMQHLQIARDYHMNIPVQL